MKAARQTGQQPEGGILTRDKRGVAALEFALVAPLFLMLVLGIAIYGLYFATQIAVTVAASQGARASLAGLSANERRSLAVQSVQDVLQTYAPLIDPATVSVTAAPKAANAGLFQVTVIAPMPLGNTLVPLPSVSPRFTATVSNGGY